MTQLARRLRTIDYFTLGFGTMVGVGWLVVMDDWLQRGGPVGAMLGFAIGGAALLPIGYVYGRMVMAIPDAASEIAYTAQVFRQEVSFATGWMMMLAYYVVCPWEAVAIGKIAAYIFPRLDTFELYRVGGQAVYLPHLILGLALTAVITAINYRGIHVSAAFQNWTTFGLLALFVVFGSFGLGRGSLHNFTPAFSHSGWLSVLLTLQIVPYFMTGFDSVPKCAEEANPEFRSRGFFRAIVAAIFVGIVFYTAVIAVVAYVYPWQPLTQQKFATAFAFEQALRGRWIVSIILFAALLSLLKVFNGNFIAATRLLFALGRRGMVDCRAGRLHETNRTPFVAVLFIGIATAIAVFLGGAILVPITEVGSMASAVGWLATCVSYFYIVRESHQRGIAILGSLVAASLIAMKLFPVVPGHFNLYEWIALFVWCAIGLVLRRRSQPSPRPAISNA